MNNTDWKYHYTKKCTTAEKAIQLIESSQTIFLAPMCNEPQVLVEELIRPKAQLQEILLYTSVLGSPSKYADLSCQPHFTIRTFLSSSLFKTAYKNNHCDYVPLEGLLHMACWLWALLVRQLDNG